MGSPGFEHASKGGYVVLQRFMVDELDLTGDELLAYAIIYGFCQDGVSACRCSRGYFAYWLGKSKTTASLTRSISSISVPAMGYASESALAFSARTKVSSTGVSTA